MMTTALPHRQSGDTHVLTLFTLPTAVCLRNVSPFCLKVEMALAYRDLEVAMALAG
jgi:hypothetical protein